MAIRELSMRESTWLDWLLPVDRPGYREFSDQVKKLIVLGEGRWGTSDHILGRIGQEIDLTEGMQPTFAYGFISGDQCDVNISLHEPNDEGQIELVASPQRMETIPLDLQELHRWTYSYWEPGAACPATNKPVREITIPTAEDFVFTLALSAAQRSVWLYDPTSRINRIIPVTNFYNELMLAKEIRDPKIALNQKYLFENLELFTDEDFIRAFKRYNVMHKKAGIALFDNTKKKQNTISGLWKKLFH